MSRELKWLSYPESKSKSFIEAEIHEYVCTQTYQESRGGLVEPIQWIDRVFDNYDLAYEYINQHDRSYAQLAVKYRVYPKIEPSSTLLSLQKRLQSEQQKRKQYAEQHSILTLKCAFVGCPNCGSKLNKKFLVREYCPLCRYDMRSKSTLDMLDKYTAKINEIEHKISEEKRRLETKMISKSTIHWLVKIEYHV